MKNMYVLSAIVLVSVVWLAHSAVPPSGKCNTHHIDPINLDPKSLLTKWDIVYVTDDGKYAENLDHVTYDITPVDENTMKMISTKVLKDQTTNEQEYTLVVVDDVILEDAIDNGKPTHFHSYPLAKTSEGALLIYRCADVSRLPVDTRFIVIPKGKTLSDEGLKQLLETDKGYKFNGELIKLPNQLS